MERGTDLFFPISSSAQYPQRKLIEDKTSKVKCRSFSLEISGCQTPFLCSFPVSRGDKHAIFPSGMKGNKRSGKLIPRMHLSQYFAFSIMVTHSPLLAATFQTGCKLIHIVLFTKRSAIFCNNLTCSFSLSFF